MEDGSGSGAGSSAVGIKVSCGRAKRPDGQGLVSGGVASVAAQASGGACHASGGSDILLKFFLHSQYVCGRVRCDRGRRRWREVQTVEAVGRGSCVIEGGRCVKRGRCVNEGEGVNGGRCVVEEGDKHK